MYISLFWIVVIICVVAYFREKRQKQLTAYVALFEAVEHAGVTASQDADKFVEDLSFWLDELPQNREIDEVIFSFYDRYQLPRPEYALIEEDLKEFLKKDLRVAQYQYHRYKRSKLAARQL